MTGRSFSNGPATRPDHARLRCTPVRLREFASCAKLMPVRMTLLAVLACAAALWLLLGLRASESRVLIHAHAHNDYQHASPLRDALEQGFASIEADVWLVDGKLLVAHDLERVERARGLEELYLRPLAERVRAQGGHVYANQPHSLQLLVDIKSEAEPTYLALHALLGTHSDLVTSWQEGLERLGAVTVIVSGNRARALMQSQALRYAAFDGRLGDLAATESPAFMPLVSDAWSAHFTWTGIGPLPAAERARLEQLVSAAHSGGRRVRFWGTPEAPGARERVWQQLRAAGVDYLNSDNLVALHDWLTAAEAD